MISSTRSRKHKVIEDISTYMRNVQKTGPDRTDREFLSEMEKKSKQLTNELKLIVDGNEISLQGVVLKYFTKPEDPEIMKIANQIYYHGSYYRRNRILMKSLQNSNNYLGVLESGENFREVFYTSPNKKKFL